MIWREWFRKKEKGNSERRLWKRKVLRGENLNSGEGAGRRSGNGGGRRVPSIYLASIFPGLCKGLIKYGWCLEQSRGKWDSTNSQSGRSRQAVMESRVFFASPASPSSLIHRLPSFSSILHFSPHTSFPTFHSAIICVCLSNSRIGKVLFFPFLICSYLYFLFVYSFIPAL